MAKKKLILDLDTGVDDAMAIAYAVAAPDADLVGIVNSYGNVVVEQAAKNSLQILDLLGASDVPVFEGESHSQTSDHFDVMPVSAHIHGKNGIGEVQLPESSRSVEKESGVDFMIDAAHKYGKDLTIIPTGPLTNLAAALRKDPAISDLIGHVTLMGGALTVPGNVSDAAEANINQDAEAANEVFTNKVPVTMVGLDVTLRTLLTKKETQQWRDLGTMAGEKFADIVDYYIGIYDEMYPELGGCSLHDPLAVGVACDPTFVKTLDLDMIVHHGKENYGRTTGDTAKLDDPNPSDKAAIQVDDERYLKTFMQYLTKLFADNK
ncbi:nucleoside hydrolase [Apilactobacillus timberlakei]|uniref:Nucleoside hydrolase n=1 Tax=Apilactobacillus timberlakei TaxID=2008380 RepID=A0ABY2YZC3_9LACO|nr:nucleoside hydrolase [Apilactobacillus timberlakei]TPR14857.1 nucleoside hydrolase [Apilactobacillus timberlakei]TPR15827.1 nucleoside hydrolase [Apilactobacillus timberlakei]TPR16188.1 nucleoside hydrolase [Apilactobacillus timberlakei]TPR18142.1 nucleoside hydrolase [Apilactobacillus timberlakei]TPR18928.1 nucleoside hydrolase [Apilactobacillus timberlakei]